MNAIVLLCYQPHHELLVFYQKFHLLNYHVYFLVDDNHWQTEDVEGITFIQIDDYVCVEQGFYDLNPAILKDSKCSAWDKAVYFFSRSKTCYDHVWFIEDDVFIPAPESLVNIDARYGDADIISANNIVNSTGELKSWWWWQLVPENVFPLPWGRSMVCVVRMSKATLLAVGETLHQRRSEMHGNWLRKLFSGLLKHLPVRTTDYAIVRYLQYQKYPFIEYLFHTVALQHHLQIVAAEELSGIVWRKDWTVAEMNQQGLYHPVKDKDSHSLLRLQMQGK